MIDRAPPPSDGLETLTAASIQMEPHLGDVQRNLEATTSLLEGAFADGARLAVLPEACSSGYMFHDADEARGVAELVPKGPACTTWTRLCASYGGYLVAGILEKESGSLYNTAVLLGPDGLVGKYRKVHLWAKEHSLYSPGDLGFPVYETAIGRLGMAICYDAWFPETTRCLALGGADIVCIPANWVPVPGQPANYPPLAHMMLMTAAHSNLVYVVAADRVGCERGQDFLGCSIIVDSQGWPISGPASDRATEVLLAELRPVGSRQERASREFNNPLAERRPDVYTPMAGAGPLPVATKPTFYVSNKER